MATETNAPKAEPKVVEAKRQIKLEDIKFNEVNKTMAILSWIPIVGLIMFFVEKDDQFVRYTGAQAFLFGLLTVLVVIPCLGQLLALAVMVVLIMGMVKTAKGERWDLPVVSDLAVKAMNAM
jgi:uncharacterized membrane protein